MSDLKLNHIKKEYPGKVVAVKDFNLEVKDGEFIILVGPSGCGKSTILRMIAGLEDISSGELVVDDKLTNYTEPKDRDFAMVFQNYALYPQMNVYDNIAFSLQVRREKKSVIDEKVHSIAKILGLEDLLKRNVAQLSGGQKQRVAIGNALIQNPRLLLMDEPLSNLDAKLRSQMRVELSKLHDETKITTIYVTHDQVEAMTLGDRIVVMNQGIVQQIDPPENLYRHPVNKFVAEFIGTPSMNFFEVAVVKKEDGIYLKAADLLVKLQEDRAKKLEGKFLTTAILGVRPEHILDFEMVRDMEEFSEPFDVHVDNRDLLGKEVLISFSLFGKSYMAKMDSSTGLVPGKRQKLSINQEEIHLFDITTGESLL